ncbi:hypothetical protein LXL04_008667 [Taraxacum kok-saghyz]
MSDMYDLRESWIPAFFKYVPLSGLMRTTSRSESQNSAFHQNTHYGSTLVHFMISFEAAMEKQRFTQLSCDFKTTDKTPRMFSVSTCDNVDKCLVKEFRHVGDSTSKDYSVKLDDDNEEKWDVLLKESVYKITYDTKEETFKCSCMKFEQFGVLCRHNGIIPSIMLRKTFRYAGSNEGISITEKPDKNKEFEKRLGVTTPDVIEVENPAQVQTKGSGSRKRYKSTLEVSTQKGRKGTRCSYCRNSNEHDWRNCPDRKEDVRKGIIKKRPGKSD